MYGHNALNDYSINSFEVGICPTCCRRLSAECEHGGGWEREQWYAAWIVAEQVGAAEITDQDALSLREALKAVER